MNSCFLLKLILFLIINLSLLMVVSCGNPNQLEYYLKNIPQYEKINASPYNYELIANKARKEFLNQNYYGVLKLYEKYLSVFFEASVPNEGELLYWVGLTVKAILKKESVSNSNKLDIDFFNYIKTNKIRKNWLGVEFDGKYVSNENGETLTKKILYQEKHFITILDQRMDYELEKKALREIYSLKFHKPKNTSDKKVLNKNLEHGYWMVTRYPDLFAYSEYITLLSKYINFKNLSAKGKKKWERMKKILSISDWVSKNSNDDFAPICFPISNSIVVYNRTDWISSRNLVSLSLWEPFKVQTQGKGEDNQEWYAITFANNRHGFIDKKSFQTACERKVTFTKKKTFQMEKYQKAYHLFVSNDFISAIKLLSDLLYDMENHTNPDMFLMVRSWTLFYQILKKIADRSTSLENPFLKFAVKHSDYFKVSKNRISLEVSDYFLKKVVDYNYSSLMLQYFDGFN